MKQGVRPEDSAPREERYVEAVGRRKTAVARARVTERGKGITVTVNGRTLQNYFPLRKFQAVVIAAFSAVSMKDATVTVKTMGGGTRAQAEAIRLAIARALVRKNVTSRPRLKTLGFLKRDPRMVERKKPGLRKARRPQQWRKR
ncbi:MAG: 30S ribosomal protein S9 [Candidatus Jorgensenbacteria bacterium]|nr:30S ribosomal protein S9 [Candidatus Jorgensenbacteria bacterium]